MKPLRSLSPQDASFLHFRVPSTPGAVSTPRSLDVRLLPHRGMRSASQRATRSERKVDVLILGAGLAGTSLAHHLERLGYEGRVALLDCRTHFRREQRWCTWSEVPPSMTHLVSQSWSSWEVCGAQKKGEESVVCTSRERRYREIYAPRFFEFFHAGWRDHDESRTELHLGQRIDDVRTQADEVFVETDDTLWRARLVFDTRSNSSLQQNAAKQNDAKSNDAHPYFAQTFLGQVVEFDRAVFNSRVATLMDFRVAQPDAGVHFAYVLPYSSSRALIETTAFSPTPTDRATHAALLQSYIETHFGGDARVVSEESGFVPMTTAHASAPTKSSTRSGSRVLRSRVERSRAFRSRVLRLGVAGGAARPSSGYAFARIQQQTQAWAQHIVDNGTQLDKAPSTRAARWRSAKYNALDEVFLQALGRSPQFAAACFLRLFEKAPTDCVVRFLSDGSSLLDDARIIAALPKIAFLDAAAQRVQARLKSLSTSQHFQKLRAFWS